MANLNDYAANNANAATNTGATNGGNLNSNHIRYELNLENGVPKGTQVLAMHLNPNWRPGDNSWMARVDIVTDEKMYLNNITIRNKKDGGYWTQYPSQIRLRNGQPEKDQNGYDIRDEYYHPYVNSQAGYSGRKLLDENLTMPLVNQCLSSPDGKAFEKPQDPWHASRMIRSSYQGSVAYGGLVVSGVPIVVRNIWARPVYDQNGGCGLRLSYPSEKRVDKNGQDILGKDGKPSYNNFVMPTKESSNNILNVVGTVLQEELNKRQ